MVGPPTLGAAYSDFPSSLSPAHIPYQYQTTAMAAVTHAYSALLRQPRRVASASVRAVRTHAADDYLTRALERATSQTLPPAAIAPRALLAVPSADAAACVETVREAGYTDVLLFGEIDERRHRRVPLGETNVLGNEPTTRTTKRAIADVAAYDGPCDLAVVTASDSANLRDDILLPLSMRAVRPGTVVVVRGASPVGDASAWEDLPLRLLAKQPEKMGAVLLAVPQQYSVPWLGDREVVELEATVERGFGRGSRQLGVPTANLSPEELEAQYVIPNGMQRKGVPAPLQSKGVYFGYAQLTTGDTTVAPCVLNVGTCPTFAKTDEKSDVTVEVHILHDYGDNVEFYGERCRVSVLGYLRPELAFSSIGDLLARINKDIGLARATLGTNTPTRL